MLYFHTHGQGLVEQHLHKLLTFAAFMCTLTSFLAGIFRNDVIVQLSKPLFVLLQGTWFVQLAFLLYPPFSLHHPIKTDHHHHHHSDVGANSANSTHIEHLDAHHHDDHRSIMITTAYFCWHFAFCLITLFSLAVICRKKFYKSEFLLNQKYQRLLDETSTHEQERVN